MIGPTVGSRIGPYEIVALLGAGGMGQVYRARDARLHRDVAIKLLPVDVADDPDRLARFEREAQLLAALSHPHIAAIYGLEESAGRKALVLELVEGGTLADRLADGPLSLDEAVAVARQVADALEAAHEVGIVHRDLKPANIALRPDGGVKILDFGLAKALDPAGSVSGEIANSPTLTSPAMTRAGVVLGTAAYMSPEQARGRAVDRRADIWALGCVLYECLTARLAFHGDTVADTIAQVLQSEPDWSKLPAGTPPNIRVLLQRCLTRDPRRRLRDIGEARIALEASGIAAGAVGDAATTTAPAPSGGSARLWKVVAGVASVAALVMAVPVVRDARNPPPSIVPIRASIALPPGLHLDGYGPPSVALSRDGRTLAMIARGATGLQQLYVRGLDQGAATRVPSSESAEGPFFSPDGRWVAFAVGVSLSGGHPPELRKYSLDTRLTQRVCSLSDYFGGVWTRADTMIFVGAQPFGLWRVAASGGTPENVVPRFRIGGKDVQKHVGWPELLPDETALALTDWDAPGIGQLVIADLQSRETTSLELAGAGPRYAPTGHLVYAGVDASLMAVRFDARSRRKIGAPVALLPDIAIARNNNPIFAFSDEGTLAYMTGFLPQSRREPQRLIRKVQAGQPLPLPFPRDLFVRGPVLSHDGRRVAASTWSEESWVLDLERDTRTKLPIPKFQQIYSLAWTKDGRVVLTATPMGSLGAGLYFHRFDGTPTMETVVSPGPVERFVFGGVLSGGALAYSENETSSDRATISSVVLGEPPRVLMRSDGRIPAGAVSPDGRLLAYQLVTTTRSEIRLSLPSGEGSSADVTTAGGHSPAWSPDGRELYFRRDRQVLAIGVSLDARGIHVERERIVFEWDAGPFGFAVGPQGEFYGFETEPGAAIQTGVQIQTGWFATIQRLAGRTASP